MYESLSNSCLEGGLASMSSTCTPTTLPPTPMRPYNRCSVRSVPQRATAKQRHPSSPSTSISISPFLDISHALMLRASRPRSVLAGAASQCAPPSSYAQHSLWQALTASLRNAPASSRGKPPSSSYHSSSWLAALHTPSSPKLHDRRYYSNMVSKEGQC
ncbi:hypothetical protein BDQ17DRAFT_643837 [Cyathus striatus]|nr:hypothetical protein BDQ17DRAFT_643837 [Cyathus striatus]